MIQSTSMVLNPLDMLSSTSLVHPQVTFMPSTSSASHLITHIPSTSTLPQPDLASRKMTSELKTYGEDKLKRLYAVPQERGKVIVKLSECAADIYFQNIKKVNLPESFLLSLMDILSHTIYEYLSTWHSLKGNLFLECTFSKTKPIIVDNILEEIEDTCNTNFKTKNQIIFKSTNIHDYLLKAFEKIIAEIDSFELKGSGWTLKSIDGIILKLTKYIPLNAACHFPLPDKIRLSKSVVNVKNDDNMCLKYAILCWYMRELRGNSHQNSHRSSQYKHLVHPFNFDKIEFPATFHDVALFEKQNPNFNLNLYALDENSEVYPLRISERVNTFATKNIDLLYLEKDSNSHYCLITDLPALVDGQLYKSNHSKSHLMCRKCFKTYDKSYITVDGKTANQRLQEHAIFCNKFKPCKYGFPKKSYIEFDDYQFMTQVGFVIYADLECHLVNVNGRNTSDLTSDKLKEANSKSHTEHREKHVPTCIGFHVKSYYEHLMDDETFLFKGRESIQEFLLKLEEVVFKIDNIYKTTNIKIHITPDEEHRHNTMTNCELCGNIFSKTILKCADHDHLNGKYRFSCCSHCNLKLKKPNFVPIFFHNLSGYDSHFIISELHKIDCKIEIIPQTHEKYISFSLKFNNHKIWVRFIDSFRFLPASLGKLVSINKDFPAMERQFPDYHLRTLLLRKGVYPYQYITNWEVLSEEQLPSKEMFYNKLTDEPISDEDYEFAQNVWKNFQIKNLLEYTMLYLKTDILLLCDVFESFRKLTYEKFSLDSAWFFTLPGFSFKAALKVSKVKLEILRDIDMLQFVESGIRGGITQCVKRHAVANNVHIPETYDPSKESNYIFYADINNLYGHAMTQKLPYGEFIWLDKVQNFDVLGTDPNGEYGYILDVDVHYPSSLFQIHADFPFLPVKNKPPGSKVEKLLLDFTAKKNYVVHLANLQQALQAKLELKKVNRVLRFKQSKWLSEYINFNTKLRKNASNDFEKDFFKLLNNAVFGKTMESVRNRLNVKMVRSGRELLKLTKKPNFLDRVIYDNKLILVNMSHEKIVFSKPVYIGFCILELSKVLFYDLHYNHMYKKYGNNISIMYMDTDSYVWEIKTENMYDDLESMAYLFDFSDYPPNHTLHGLTIPNKKVIGKLKDETNSIPIKQFVALRPKLYAFQYGNEEKKKAKGVKKSAVRTLEFNDYLHTLNTKQDMYTSFQKIGSKLHHVYTDFVCKKALSFYDDKRIIMENGVDTKPYGYYDSRESHDIVNQS